MRTLHQGEHTSRAAATAGFFMKVQQNQCMMDQHSSMLLGGVKLRALLVHKHCGALTDSLCASVNNKQRPQHSRSPTCSAKRLRRSLGSRPMGMKPSPTPAARGQAAAQSVTQCEEVGRFADATPAGASYEGRHGEHVVLAGSAVGPHKVQQWQQGAAPYGMSSPCTR
jgi:hypothetical protein